MSEQPTDESLVAFLDGELSDVEANQVRQAASQDQSVQQRIDKLNDSWSMLDELPEETLNPKVAQSTLEMVTLAIEKESLGWFGWLAKYRLPIIMASALVALGCGMAYSQAEGYFRKRETLTWLHFVVAAENLSVVPSTEFLEMLTEIDNLGSLNQSPPPSGQPDPAAARRELFAMPVDQREAWIEQLEPTEKQHLATKLRAFTELPKDELDRAVKVGEYIGKNPERAGEYFAAIDAFCELVHNNTGFAVAIEDAVASADQELQTDLINEQLAYQYRLTDADRTIVNHWADDVYWDTGSMLSGLETELVVVFVLSQYPADDPDAAEYMDDLASLLVSQAKKLFTAVPQTSRRDVAIAWLRLSHEVENGGFDSAKMRERFNELTRRKKDELLMLPADAVRTQLTSPIAQ